MTDPAVSEAINWIIPLVGGGGLSAVLVAYFGSKRPRAETQPHTAAVAGIGALLADHYSVERLTSELRRLADANERLAGGINRYCDLMDIAQALDRLHGRKPDDRRTE
jgi:hypothetical protein